MVSDEADEANGFGARARRMKKGSLHASYEFKLNENNVHVFVCARVCVMYMYMHITQLRRVVSVSQLGWHFLRSSKRRMKAFISYFRYHNSLR